MESSFIDHIVQTIVVNGESSRRIYPSFPACLNGR